MSAQLVAAMRPDGTSSGTAGAVLSLAVEVRTHCKPDVGSSCV